MRPKTVLTILIVAFVALGITYASVTPYRQAGTLLHQGGAAVPDIGAPDERQHANYVEHVLSGQGFPVLEPGSPDLIETYQSHQPPLYYIVASGWAKLTLATPADPHTGGRLRWLSVLIGVGTLLGIYWAAKWGIGREDVALASVAFAGLMPMFVALNSAVSNDPLAYLVCAWTVALCARGLRLGWNWRLGALVGALVGVGLLTKTTCLALVPTAIAGVLAARLWAGQKPCLRTWALVILLPFIVASPWMVRNTKLYGDPFAIKIFQEAFTGSPRPRDVVIPSRVATDPVYNEAALEAQQEFPKAQGRELIDRIYDKAGGLTLPAKIDYWTNWVGWWAARSYVGVLGYMDVFILDARGMRASNAFYRLAILLLLVCFVGWILSLRQVKDGAERGFHVVGAVLLLVVLAMFVRFNLVYFQGQARYLYPAVAPISIGLACGLVYWLKARGKWAWVWTGVVLLVFQALAIQAMVTAFGQRAI